MTTDKADGAAGDEDWSGDRSQVTSKSDLSDPTSDRPQSTIANGQIASALIDRGVPAAPGDDRSTIANRQIAEGVNDRDCSACGKTARMIAHRPGCPNDHPTAERSAIEQAPAISGVSDQ